MKKLLPALALALCALVSAPASAAPKTPTTALDEYVAKPDTHFRWELKGKAESPLGTYYLLEMTSQKWRTEAEVSHPVWTHWVSVYRPSKVTAPIGLMFISGGSISGGSIGSRPPRPDARSIEIAATTNSVVVELRGIPNEPVQFSDETATRNEDEIIAYTWDRYLKTGDGTWPLRLPMTKAVMRGMDAASEFLRKQDNVTVDRWVVSGGSKRGWTAWTTAAVDPRVVAAAPVVIDCLNVVPSFIHHYRVYGFWAPAVKDYYDMGLMDQLRNPKYRELMAIVDPYSYRARYTMPKYIVNSAGDQFFLPDSSRFYFDDLPGEKYLRYIPNSDHSLRNTDVWQSLTAFYNAVLKNEPRPRFAWKFEKNGAIRVTATDRPSAVKLWRATNPKHRDFRLESLGPVYESTDLEPAGEGVYVARVPKPASGFTAYFVELTFPSSIQHPFKFTTPVRVIPDVLPFPAPVPGKTKVGTKQGG